MPYIDKFLKSYILKDKKRYIKGFRTGRIFTDYFDELYASDEREEHFPLCKEEDLYKINLSWAPCYDYYSHDRYSLKRKVFNRILPFFMNYSDTKLDIKFTDPFSERKIPVSARFGLSHSRPSVVDHRKSIAAIIEKRSISTSRIPLPDYFNEMQNAQISISPFGVGEFCYRDYESIICGTALLKPDMSHLETWPDFYIDGVTFTAHKWDLSDFEDKLDSFLANPEKRVEIAEEAQRVYQNALSHKGISELTERIIAIINNK
jgi:hypothetical protein